MSEDGFLRRIRKLITPLKSLPEDTAPGAQRVSQTEHKSQQVDAVARVYAGALFELAQAGGALEGVAAQVNEIAALLDEHADLRRLLSTPAINKLERRAMLERIFADRYSDEVYNFIQVLNNRGRIGSLPGIIAAFDERLDRYRNVVEVEAHVADELSPLDAGKVADAVGKKLGKQVVLTQYIDPNLIGGLKLKIGDRLIDGSVATQLRAMKRRLSEVGYQKARSATAQ